VCEHVCVCVCACNVLSSYDMELSVVPLHHQLLTAQCNGFKLGHLLYATLPCLSFLTQGLELCLQGGN